METQKRGPAAKGEVASFLAENEARVRQSIEHHALMMSRLHQNLLEEQAEAVHAKVQEGLKDYVQQEERREQERLDLEEKRKKVGIARAAHNAPETPLARAPSQIIEANEFTFQASEDDMAVGSRASEKSVDDASQISPLISHRSSDSHPASAITHQHPDAGQMVHGHERHDNLRSTKHTEEVVEVETTNSSSPRSPKMELTREQSVAVLSSLAQEHGVPVQQRAKKKRSRKKENRAVREADEKFQQQIEDDVFAVNVALESEGPEMPNMIPSLPLGTPNNGNPSSFTLKPEEERLSSDEEELVDALHGTILTKAERKSAGSFPVRRGSGWMLAYILFGLGLPGLIGAITLFGVMGEINDYLLLDLGLTAFGSQYFVVVLMALLIDFQIIFKVLLDVVGIIPGSMKTLKVVQAQNSD